MSTLNISQLHKHFDDFHAIRGINLSIEEGEFVVFVGPSGCGKSTLLRLIAGLEDVSGGNISLGDRDITQVPAAQRDLAMVFQSYALYPQMTVEGNLSFGLKNAKLPKPEIAKRVKHASEVLQIEPLLKRKPAALSGGQRQRVAIGRALVRDVDVFLFDEPLSNLDAKLRADLRVEIKRLHHKLQNTMIYVTHDQIEAMTLADRIAIMRGGQIMQLGSPDEIYGRPINKYVADFIGSPSMNFLEGNIQNGTFEVGELSIPLDGYEFGDAGAATEGAATMGIRPEHVVTGELVESTPFQVDVEVNLIEPTGSDTLVDCEVAGQHFRVRMDGQSRVSVGEKLRLGFAPARVSLFDSKTELRL